MDSPEGLLSIGQFARASGLTAKALRHYNAVGLLAPVFVDPASGYRRYRADQVEAARLIRRLRGLDLPVAEVRRLLDLYAADPEAMTDALVSHRRRLVARATRLKGQIHDLDHLVAGKEWESMPERNDKPSLDAEVQRKLAAALFNRVWTLLEQESRTEAEDAEMMHAAHASTYHWMQVGQPVNRARGEWQCSRVYAVLGMPVPALFHARKVLDICQREGIADFDLAFAYEALARAAAIAGDTSEARRWAEMARAACEQVAEEDDREIVIADLETLPAGI
ncbi:MAG TPA: helix-turn-helix domain-containing protein [Streptosporangiaceae bacterium]